MSETDTDPAAAAHTGSGAARGGWLRWVGVAGLCAVIWGGLVLAWPYWEKHRASEIVAEHFEWDETEKAAKVKIGVSEPGPVALGELDRKTVRALRILGTRRLEIYDSTGITGVAALRDIATLQSVDLVYCTGLTNVAGLPAGLQKLILGFCTGLSSVAGLPAGLRELTVLHCTGLRRADELPAGVERLSLYGCTGLTSVAGFPAGLQELDVGDCIGLTSVAGLPAGVQELYLSGCTGLERLGEVPAGLKKVNLRNTPKLPEAVKAEIRALVKKNGGEVIE